MYGAKDMNLIERLRSDWTYLDGFMRLTKGTEGVDPEGLFSIADAIEASCDLHSSRDFIVFENAVLTYSQFDRRANQFAHWGLSIGLKPGDCVALFMDNRPDYIAFWFGMAKIAVRTALINSNLSGPGLAHCVTIASAKAAVMNVELIDAFSTIGSSVPLEKGAWALGETREGIEDLGRAINAMPTHRPDRLVRADVRSTDTALYIYTSGTTGLPKAARITGIRANGLMKVFKFATPVRADDRVLQALPLYHATGGMCGVGSVIFSGATLILQRKFSASQFWREAIDTRATLMVYIGELCRYLMNQPPSSLERSHSIVRAFGNGLRPDVWEQFVKRTGVRRIVEFYGSTEGNVSFFNLDGRQGAIGRIPPLLSGRIQSRLLRFDVEAEAPVRGADGLCIEAAVDEPGEAVGPISAEARQRFDGYNDEEQTKKKVLRDVFAKGDIWFRTGDLLKKDRDGYIYFVDRIGDTFRWKSENVSTSEVEIAISSMPGVEHVVVYGVQTPGHDGRAGMAAITASAPIDLKDLQGHLSARLPSYARPVFLRLTPEVETTGTFKYRKVDLVRQGFDPMNISDPLFVFDAEAGGYSPIDGEMFRRISEGYMRF
jgi:fatty-acyl-CoA synthase